MSLVALCITNRRMIKYGYINKPGGAATAGFGIAVNRRWQNQQTQEWEEKVSFFNVTCWRQLAENVSESLTKGSRVVVVGRLEQRSWDDDEGNKKSVVEIVADEVAPSLSYATVEISRNERSDSTTAPSGGHQSSKTRSGDEPF
jgi:single-strand DNA-binding protein